MNQQDMMVKDECILVDKDDAIVGHSSKQFSHEFSNANPRGLLHRAFSVFLFDLDGRLLLQQRAKDKITFPLVWTNTCCSHPLYGFTPSEVDNPDDISNETVPGIKNAAIRKLKHELGIDSKLLKHSDIKFLTRLHYWAADVVTHGADSPWGEHEIDFILFVQKKVHLQVNPEEVHDTRYVTLDELQSMMSPTSGLLWSPWFRIIAEQFLVHWWSDLRATITTRKFVDVATIHRFDPSAEHMGGKGKAGPWLGRASSPYESRTDGRSDAAKVGNAALKQGSYGKVQIHKHSVLTQLSHVDEVFAALWLTYGAPLPNKADLKDADRRFCDDMLNKVSRSFAAVIRQLPTSLCMDVLIFYLALRALDTIEDDMVAFKDAPEVKIAHLQSFYRTGLVTDGWSMQGVGEGDERVLLEQYSRCVSVFKSLSVGSQEIITDITKRMGAGMASYVEQDLGQGCIDVEAYNLYCHYVAGLVGEGLSRLFTSSGYESDHVAGVSRTLANTMGLFLQKTNIVRDYLEDYVDGRTFWPQSVWKTYALTSDLREFAQPHARERALACLNHLITDALQCAQEALEYMSLLRTEEVFRFCAIPQVMAIATLAELYDNPLVFSGVVKIRKGMAAQLLLDTKSTGGLHKWFNIFARQILKRIPPSDPNAAKTRQVCEEIIALTDRNAQMAIAGNYAQALSVAASIAIIITAYLVFAVDVVHKEGRFSLQPGLFSVLSSSSSSSSLSTSGHNSKLISAAVLVCSVLYIFGYSIVSAGRKGLRRAD